jgi:hypothetical protein
MGQPAVWGHEALEQEAAATNAPILNDLEVD